MNVLSHNLEHDIFTNDNFCASRFFLESILYSLFLFSVTVPFPVEFHGIEGIEVLSKENPSFENFEESVKIMKLVEELRNDGIDLTSMCVVAFYPAQVI